VAIHERLAASVSLVQNQDVVDVDENGFVGNNYFFVAFGLVSKNEYTRVSDIEIPVPVHNESLVLTTVSKWIHHIDFLDVEAELSIMLVGNDVNVPVLIIKHDCFELLQIMFFINVNFSFFFEIYIQAIF
jgi:hypothetical protein